MKTSGHHRRKFLSKASQLLGLSLLSNQLFSQKAEAATWKKLQVGSGSTTYGVYTWGLNDWGQLGNNTTTDQSAPVKVCGIDSVLTVAMGYWHALAVLQDGRVMAWGANDCGQLGTNDLNTHQSTPVVVCGISTAIAVAAGSNQSAALLLDGTIRTWGENINGDLGDGTTTTRSSPVAVCGISTAVAISLNTALLSNGTIMSWGIDNNSQLGRGTTSSVCVPVAACGISTAVAISNAGMQRFAVLADGTIKAWGRNNTGQVGNNTSGNVVSLPVTVCGITNAVSVYTGFEHTVALLRNGKIMSWGSAGNGRLGDGTVVSKSTPVFVCGISTAVALGTSVDTPLALLADGSLMTWGPSTNGVLGNNATTAVCTPVAVCTISKAYRNVARAKSVRHLPTVSRGDGNSFSFLHLG